MWAPIEADFRRFYGINLTQELHTMTWRTFCVLLGNLPPEAVTIATHQNKPKETIRTIENPQELAQFLGI